MSRSLPQFHHAAMASAFTLSIVSPMAVWAEACDAPPVNPLVVNISTESMNYCDDEVSLREAIAYANANLGKDTITFEAGLNGQTIQPTNGLILVRESVTITGQTEPELTKLKASDADSLFHIESMGDRIDFDLSNTVLEKAGGADYLIEMDGYGGDINLDNIHTNEATRAYGIFYNRTNQSENNDLNLTLKNSSISGSVFGEEILTSRPTWNSETSSMADGDHNLVIDNSIVSSTSAYSLAAAGGKGSKDSINVTLTSSVINNESDIRYVLIGDTSEGISNVTIQDSKITNSYSRAIALSGGGMENNLNVLNSTISKNSVYTLMENYSYGDSQGGISIENSTISENIISNKGIAVSGNGSSSINIEDAILCDNITDYGGDVAGEYPLIVSTSEIDLQITDSTICDNQLKAIDIESSYGGPVTATIKNSRISNNHSSDKSAGILATASSNGNLALNIENSTIDNNSGFGGGIDVNALYDSNLILTLINSTVSSNKNDNGSDDGGLSLRSDANSQISAKILYTTITKNENSSHGAGVVVNGTTENTNVVIKNSIIADNNSYYGADNDLFGSFTVENSLIGDNTTHNGTTINDIQIDQIGNGEGQTPDTDNNILGVDPLLQDLALSGSSWVHQLTAESPAIGAGNASAENLPEFDQRGDGFARIRNENSAPELDMGAVQYFVNPIAVNDAVSVTQNSSNNVLSILYNDALSSNGLALDSGSITIMSHPENGTAEVQEDGTLLYTPNADYLGDDTFTYVVQDIGGNTSTEATVTINVAKASSGGGSMNYWLLSLLALFGLNRRK